MKMIRKMRSFFHDDWCSECTEEMEVLKKQLYMLPMTVGHYVSHREASYYIKNLVKVDKKKDIPTGYYACGLHSYRCPKCGHRSVKLSIFLPVRNEEKQEEVLFFEKGEMDELFQDERYKY